YEDDKPVKLDHYFKWSKTGAKDGDLVFVSGNPGRTDRLLTLDELKFQRDVATPGRLLRLPEYRGRLTEFARRSPDSKRISQEELFGVENSYKALKGREEALLDDKLISDKEAAEKDLRAKIAKDPEKQKKYGAAFDAISASLQSLRKFRVPLN